MAYTVFLDSNADLLSDLDPCDDHLSPLQLSDLSLQLAKFANSFIKCSCYDKYTD